MTDEIIRLSIIMNVTNGVLWPSIRSFVSGKWSVRQLSRQVSVDFPPSSAHSNIFPQSELLPQTPPVPENLASLTCLHIILGPPANALPAVEAECSNEFSQMPNNAVWCVQRSRALVLRA